MGTLAATAKSLCLGFHENTALGLGFVHEWNGGLSSVRKYGTSCTPQPFAEQDNKNKALWFHFALKVTIPILGILLEFLGSRFAKWVNVGYLVFVGTVFSAVGIWTWPDHHGLIYLFLGLLALAFAGVSWLLYRRPRLAPLVSPK